MAASDSHLRASDAEREQVVDQLRQHAADGRLTMDEFEQRVAEALAAKTHADLEPVLRELPPLEAPSQVTPRRRMPLPSARALLTAVAVVFAVVMITQGFWWIVFPLMGVFGGCGRNNACATGWKSHSHRGHNHRGVHTDVPDERELIRV